MLKAKKMWIAAFLAPTVILFLLIYAIPMAMVFVTSFLDYRLTSREITFAGLANYKRMFGDVNFFTAFTNTVIWILLHCIAHVAIGVLIALLLYRRPKGWKFIRTAYMTPSIISNAAMAMIFVNIFNPKFGVINSVLRAAGLGHIATNWLMDKSTAFGSVTVIWFIFAGYTTTLVLAQALSIDENILEAASIDGASKFQIDIFIMLPLLRRMIGTTMVMAAIYMLQMFDLIYLTTQGGPGHRTTNLPLLLYRVYMSENNYGYANAIGVVIVVLGAISMGVIHKVMGMNKEDF